MTGGSERLEKLQQLLARWVLVVLPTLIIGYVTLRFVNFSYTALNTGIAAQAAYFGAGLLAAYTLYFFRARWIITFLLLWLGYWFIERAISRLPGEFDVFYAMARFQLYYTLFIFGWVFGFLLARWRWSYVVIFGVLGVVTLVSVSDTVDVSIEYILLRITPVALYGLYMFFVSPLLATNVSIDAKRFGRFALRLTAFVVLILLAFVVTGNLLKGNLTAVEKELAARGAKNNEQNKEKDGGYDERHGLMEKADDGYRLKDTMKVTTRMSQSDKLMFCSRLDNFTPDGEPVPLYFVYHYLTRYDPVKESFTRDVNVPSLDEMDVDPAALPLYYSVVDTSIFRKTKADKYRKVVEAQIYLSENTWKHAVLGPASVFAIQTIPVERDFQKTFLSAYKINAYVSDLNNAYFVYNVSANPQLDQLQDQRHDELRSVRNYKGIDQEFLEYYTAMPTGGIYDSIAQLARGLVKPDARPVDKVLAVRDFFLQRNENGRRVFRYTLKPGAIDDPNIPSSKMLYNFLFKTKAGYCTYYAGASHFMLRALGIPTRFTTGFATINRSDKNKGWYWFYASQAHAWTQVYFPEYGWLDFDMTIGNEDQQSAPKPDGTPPLPPPDPWLVLNARAEAVDAPRKKLDASFAELLYFDKPYALKETFNRNIDATLCRVVYGDKDTTFTAIQPGDSIIIVSYKDEAKRIPQPRAGVAIEAQVRAFPSPIIADEIHIRPKPKPEKEDNPAGTPVKPKEPSLTWQQIAQLTAQAALVMLIVVLLMPALYLLYRLLRVAMASTPQAKADQVYRAALYRFHMAGLEREGETPLEYARHVVDPALNGDFETFMRTYLRLKYTDGQLRDGDEAIISQFAANAGVSVRKKFGVLATLLNYFNLARASRYFQQPIKPEPETSTI